MTKHDEIAQALTDEILANRFLPGERLPSERDLALRFDANRGAVREAMKKVAQMGLATIQPGGARVEPLQHASLDVIGMLLTRGETPDAHLIVQVLEVVNSLAQVAISHVVDEATDAELSDIRTRIQPLLSPTSNAEQHAIARMEVLRAIMLTSRQLVCQIIARSLFEQLIQVVEKGPPANIDSPAHRALSLELDTALARRDKQAALVAMQRFESLNRSNVLAAIGDHNNANVVEVSI